MIKKLGKKYSDQKFSTDEFRGISPVEPGICVYTNKKYLIKKKRVYYIDIEYSIETLLPESSSPSPMFVELVLLPSFRGCVSTIDTLRL